MANSLRFRVPGSKAQVVANTEDIGSKSLPIIGGEMSGNITFSEGSKYNIGTQDKKVKAVYADEVFISKNTLYINNTPVLGSDSDTINVKADPDQSILVKTTGEGLSQITSESGIVVSANGQNANVAIAAKGNNGAVNISSSQNINVTADNITLTGTVNVKDLNVTGATTTVNSNNMSVKDNLIEINSGETGNGVSSGLAGLKVMRGDASPYFIEFDESDDLFKVGMSGELEAIASRPWVTTAITDAINAKYEKEFTIAAGGNVVQEDKISKTARLLVLDPYEDSDTYNYWVPADSVAVLAINDTGYKIFNYEDVELKFMVVA